MSSSTDVTEASTIMEETTSNNYPQEEEPPLEDEASRFKWRLDPQQTFSDWKIEIVTNDEGALETYHVHKCHLAVGSRRSEYFSRLFHNKDHFKEAQDCTSRIELEPLAARSFPCLLDYIYAPERPLEITTETATALHQLGEYFEMKHLRWDAKQFGRTDISLENAELYYQHATLFQNETILGILADFLGKNIEDVALDSAIVQETDPQLWVKASKTVDPTNTVHWSEVVCQVGHSHMNTLDKSTFQDLSQAAAMPKVQPGIALDLCELEDTLPIVVRNEDCPDDLSEVEEEEDPGLSSLQERCATALSEIWRELETYDQDILTNLKRRKSPFLVDLLVKCLEEFKCEVREAKQQLLKATTVIRKFKPFEHGYNLYGGSHPVPQDIIEHNPREDGSSCRQTQVNFIQTGFQYCPVFYYANL